MKEGIIPYGFKSGEINVWVLDKNINIEITQNSLKEFDPYKNKDKATSTFNYFISNFCYATIEKKKYKLIKINNKKKHQKMKIITKIIKLLLRHQILNFYMN